MDNEDNHASSTPPAHALESQVGGHAGVLTTEDGSLIIKPVLRRELDFYQAIQQDSALEILRAFTPKFLGTLKLEGTVDPTQPESTEGLNLSHPFHKPNILDIKLGTVLHEETASAEKIARMVKTAQSTTSFETGIRLTGFQVYDNITSQPVNTPKSYGKTIKAAELHEGIAKFFPVGVLVSETTESFESVVSSSTGLPRETLILILRAIREEVGFLRETYASLEVRMVGGSMLIIYEADWSRAAEGIKKHLEDEEEEEEEDAEDEEEDEDEEDEDSETKRPGPPFVVKLIDFAHTLITPGQGPDEGVLLGMDTVLKLLDTRLEGLALSP
ncbi:hypothetical protein BDZ97DRAFT_1666790 [Flammula alnicola]|nr:hypothetical protein BDZ97DRAFT_1666790 [Flammula alnicola]